MVGRRCCTTTWKSTNLSMYRKCAESTLSTGTLNSSSNCCGSQQVHPRPHQENVLRASSVFRIFCMKGICDPFGARVASRVEICRRNVGTSTSSFGRRHGVGPLISHCMRHTACLNARVHDFCDHGHTMNHMFVGCLRRDCRHTETPKRLLNKETRLPQQNVKEDASTSGVAETSAMRYSAGLCRDTKPKSPQRQGRKIRLPRQHARSDVATYQA